MILSAAISFIFIDAGIDAPFRKILTSPLVDLTVPTASSAKAKVDEVNIKTPTKIALLILALIIFSPYH
jgi:hypothetical protein